VKQQFLKLISLTTEVSLLLVLGSLFISCSDNSQLKAVGQVNHSPELIGEADTLPNTTPAINGTNLNNPSDPSGPSNPSGPSDSLKPSTPSTTPILDTGTIMRHIMEISGSSNPQVKKEFIQRYLDVNNTAGKEVKVCLWFDRREEEHNCDDAKFKVKLNDVMQSTQLNLNNVRSRTHRGISGKNYTVPEQKRPATNFTGKYNSVPGTAYTGRWNNQARLVITTSCDSYCDSGKYYCTQGQLYCHDGIASMTVYGKIVLNYGGRLTEVIFIDRKTHIRTTSAETYDLVNQDYEIVTTDPTFNDWCQITL
jgi:hypothetical protein